MPDGKRQGKIKGAARHRREITSSMEGKWQPAVREKRKSPLDNQSGTFTCTCTYIHIYIYIDTLSRKTETLSGQRQLLFLPHARSLA